MNVLLTAKPHIILTVCRGSNCPSEQNCGASIKPSIGITEINEPSQCHVFVLPDDSLVARVWVDALNFLIKLIHW